MRRLLCVTCLLALTGCDRQPTVRADTRAVTIAATDYRLRPQHVSVPAGRIRVTLDNTGIVPHNLLIRASARDVLARIRTVLPGDRRAVAVRLNPGTYEIVSTVGRDEQLGQRGTLVVR